ncbi:MAG TPA: hypothetical protein VGQ99_15995, partial [Tepidisphaeraceae bacterium]|nr:hypothetical protein [Tepidisphaeraceae bacterium]
EGMGGEGTKGVADPPQISTDIVAAHVGKALAVEIKEMSHRGTAAEAAPTNAPTSTPTKNATRRLQLGSAGAWGVGIVLVTLVIVLPFAIAQLSRPAKGDYGDLLAKQRKAESLVAAGDLAGAHEAYGDLFNSANARAVDDPMVLERLAKAKTDEKRIAGILSEEARRRERRVEVVIRPKVLPATAAVKGPATAPAIVVAKVVESAPSAVAATQAVVRSEAATQPIVRSEPKAVMPATMPVVVMIPRAAPLPRPPTQHLKPEGEGITDQEIGESIQRGANYLLNQFANGRLVGDNMGRDPGLNALCVYALLQCGQAVADERLNGRAKGMKAMLDNLRNSRMEGYETYGRAIRATALGVYNRAEDREALKADVQWLLNATRSGAYTYGEGNRTNPGQWDNSNSQYGLLGVWSGAEVGMEVPRGYWSQVQNHWYECQLNSGEWAYSRSGYGGGTLSMSVAGIASLFVTHDYLDAPQFGTVVGREPFSRPLARGLAWLEQGDNCLQLTSGWPGYNLYGIERVGLASGFKYLGAHDWYRELASRVVAAQGEDGSWSNRGAMRLRWQGAGREEMIETSYSLLFLARGRHPIIMNKLRFAGAWANRPRDVANLARFASRELERPL